MSLKLFKFDQVRKIRNAAVGFNFDLQSSFFRPNKMSLSALAGCKGGGNPIMKVSLRRAGIFPKRAFSGSFKSLSKYNMTTGFGLGQTKSMVNSYGTWALTHLTDQNAGRIQPIFDVDFVIKNMNSVIESIEAREIKLKSDVTKIAQLYEATLEAKKKRDEAEMKREENTNVIQDTIKTNTLRGKKENSQELVILREQGKVLREEFRELNSKFNQLNDELVDLLISIPNLLHPETPVTEIKLLHDLIPPDDVPKWKYPKNLRWDIIPGISPCPEFPVGEAAVMELTLASKVHTYLLSKGFAETGNVNFVKRILLEGSGLDSRQFLRIREPNVKVGLSHATYLVGGASFPAFLALFAQSILQDHTQFPIKYFVNGRSYLNKPGKIPGTYQCSSCQVFIAARTEEELNEEYRKLQMNIEDFYKNVLGISCSAFLYPARRLQKYEKQKVGFYSEANEKILGNISYVSDYVSKRLLCCYKDEQGIINFLHLLTGQFFNITEFLRPAFTPISKEPTTKSTPTTPTTSTKPPSSKK